MLGQYRHIDYDRLFQSLMYPPFILPVEKASLNNKRIKPASNIMQATHNVVRASHVFIAGTKGKHRHRALK
jgi:hypothetical protein